MNDFTKEELVIIRSLINSTDYRDLTASKEAMIVQSKIQSMIDNYCECKHTRTMTDTFVKCQDCKKVIGYDE